jgi:hypothetical protein
LFFFFKNQKWYFTVAFFCYPLLLFFWFIPKWILFTGKIYIFLYYLNFILKIIKNFKKAVFVVAVALVLTILLVFGDSTIVKWFAVFFFSYVYYLFIKNFLREIFRPSKFSEKSSKTKIEEYFALDDPSNVPFIRDLENQKQDDKLSPQEKESRIKERLININYLFAYLTQTLNGFRNERSYIFFCLFQLLLYFSISVLYFAFLNFQVFQINNNLFAFFSIPSFFDFI